MRPIPILDELAYMEDDYELDGLVFAMDALERMHARALRTFLGTAPEVVSPQHRLGLALRSEVVRALLDYARTLHETASEREAEVTLSKMLYKKQCHLSD